MRAKQTIALVGAGGIAQSHLEALREIDEAEVVAVCDPRSEAARAAADPLGADC